MGDEVFGRGRNAQAEYAVPDSWARKPPSIDWVVAAADVLDERVPNDDDPGLVVAFEATHRS